MTKKIRARINEDMRFRTCLLAFILCFGTMLLLPQKSFAVCRDLPSNAIDATTPCSIYNHSCAGFPQADSTSSCVQSGGVCKKWQTCVDSAPTSTPAPTARPQIFPTMVPTQAAVASNCNFATHPLADGVALQVCYGSPTQQSVKNSKVTFTCQDCENPVTAVLGQIFKGTQGTPLQTLSFTEISQQPDAQGLYYSCTGGQVSSDVVNASISLQNLSEIGCGAIPHTLGGDATVSFANNQFTVNAPSVTDPTQSQCLKNALSSIAPKLHADVTGGLQSCSTDLSFSVNAQTGQVTVINAGTNGPPPGTEVANTGKAGFLFAPCSSQGGSYVGSMFVSNGGVQTALGCIPTSPGALVTMIFDIVIGIAGGVAFLLVILGGIKVLTSAGNPEALTEGKEIISSAIVGLLLIIFSVFLLHFIGVNVLNLPGFN